MKKWCSLFLGMTLLLCACGQKGPLTLPNDVVENKQNVS